MEFLSGILAGLLLALAGFKINQARNRRIESKRVYIPADPRPRDYPAPEDD